MSQLAIEHRGDAVVIKAKIVPGSSKTSIEGLLDDMLKIKVAAAPEKGKANKELTAFLAKKLEIRKANVSVISGLTSPVKQLEIHGISKSNLLSLLELETK